MINKIYEIPDLLVFSITDVDLLTDIKQFYPNLVESNKQPEYYFDRTIVDNLDRFLPLTESQPLRPFRNCIYYSQILSGDDQVIAYALKTNQTIEHAIYRQGNNIQIIYKDDNPKVFTRTIRELIFRKYLQKGYFPLHASAIFQDGKVELNFGPKGCGKSTVLFQKVIDEQSFLLSNDITLVGKENNIWNAVCISYTLSFDSSLLNKCQKEKIRFTPKEFCDVFGISCVTKGPIQKISYLSLNKNDKYQETELSEQQLLEKLILYGKDHGFYFDDYLNINGIYPNFDYESLSESLIAFSEKGNVFYKSR